MIPNSFSSVVGVNLELLAALNQSTTLFTKIFTNRQSRKLCSIESSHHNRDIQMQLGHPAHSKMQPNNFSLYFAYKKQL